MIEPAYLRVLVLTGCDVETRDSSGGPWQESGREGVLAMSNVWRYQTRIPMSSAVFAPRARSRNRTQAQSPVPTNSTEDMPRDH